MILIVTLPYVLMKSCTGGKTLQQLSSPDGHAIALVVRSQTASAVDSDIVSVIIRSRWNPLFDHLFSGVDRGAKIKLSWLDSHHLFVTCEECFRLERSPLDDPPVRHWNDVTIDYDIQNWFNPQLKKHSP